MTQPHLVRIAEQAPWHLAAPTRRGYVTACSRTLVGDYLQAAPWLQRRRAWRLELVCAQCEARQEAARRRRGR